VDEAAAGDRFLGREETVQALYNRFEDARLGAAGVTILLGETGVGKSTLVAQLLHDIRTHGVRVLLGRAPAVDDPPPFSLIDSALESAHDDPTLRSDEDPSFGGEQYLLGFAPTVHVDEVVTPVGIEERLLEVLGATDRRGKMSRDEILTRITQRFLEITAHGPAIILLDDLDRADASSLAALEFFAKELQNRPLWIVATTRPYGSLSDAGRGRLESFEKATQAGRILLPPMTSTETAEYLRIIDPARKFSPDEIEWRFSESNGNPLLLQQLDRRNPAVSEPRRPAGIALPSLDAEAQRALDVAAVLGPEFGFALLLRASGEDEEHLAEAVERLVVQGLLFERPGETLEFPVDRLREEAYAGIADDRRRLLHRRSGAALEAMGSADPSRAFALARHFYLGRDSRRSVQYNRLAAEAADRALAPDVARDHLARALESHRDLPPEERDGEWELVLELARMTYDLGRLQEAERLLRDFLDREKDSPVLAPPVRATLEICLAQVLIARGELPAAAALAEKVLASPGLEGQLLVRIGAHHQLGQTLYYDGHYPEALRHHAEEVRLAEEAGNERVIAHARLWRAGVLAMMGQTEEALAEARAVAVALDRLGSARESGQGHLFLGNILADTKSAAHRGEAIAELGEAIRLAGKAQDPRRVGWAHYHAAELLRDAGRFEEAVEHVAPACDILGRIGDRTGLSMSLKVRGQIAMQKGSYDLAGADLLEAYRVIQGLNQAMIEVDVLLRLAQLDYARGDRAGARRRVAELERQNLPTLRTDLAEEFERLRRDVAAPESGPTAA